MKTKRSKLFDDDAPHAPKPAENLCRAHECPCRASIFDSVTGTPMKGLCRYHNATPSALWPELTQVLRSGPMTVAFMRPALLSAGFPWFSLRPEKPTVDIDPSKGPKAWANALRAREEAGEKLLPVQRSAWRIALGMQHSLAQVEGIEERAAIMEEAQA